MRGGALLAALGALSRRQSAAAQATPGAGAGAAASDSLLVQSFSQGSLFPTQGDVGVLPYTAILWDAADRGFFSFQPASGVAGVAATTAVLSALGAGSEPPRALLLTHAAGDSGSGRSGQGIWGLRLVAGELGSDPGAVTYQGEPLPATDAAAWLGIALPDLASGPQELGPGYLIIAGLSALDDEGEQIRLHTTEAP